MTYPLHYRARHFFEKAVETGVPEAWRNLAIAEGHIANSGERYETREIAKRSSYLASLLAETLTQYSTPTPEDLEIEGSWSILDAIPEIRITLTLNAEDLARLIKLQVPGTSLEETLLQVLRSK